MQSIKCNDQKFINYFYNFNSIHLIDNKFQDSAARSSPSPIHPTTPERPPDWLEGLIESRHLVFKFQPMDLLGQQPCRTRIWITPKGMDMNTSPPFHQTSHPARRSISKLKDFMQFPILRRFQRGEMDQDTPTRINMERSRKVVNSSQPLHLSVFNRLPWQGSREDLIASRLLRIRIRLYQWKDMEQEWRTWINQVISGKDTDDPRLQVLPGATDGLSRVAVQRMVEVPLLLWPFQ